MNEILLLPVPRKIRIQKQLCRIPGEAKFCLAGIENQHTLFADFINKFTKKHTGNAWRQSEKYEAFLLVVCNPDAKIPEQGYRLKVSKDSIMIESSDACGVYYGLCTLKQILQQKNGVLPVLEIDDYPDFKHRGVMIDISRSKVPTMETLYNLVDLLSCWKINQIQLYTEHTFAYKGHEIVWKDSSPMTPEEIRNLDEYCRERFVELVPNQNSFGHFHRWLMHPQYKHLAEDPENPTTLCPTDPGSIQLLDDLYRQLLPNFKSKNFNVGCDETVLSKRSASAIREKGEGRVYLEFLLKIYNLVKKHDSCMQFWGDIIQRHPELIRELPQNITVLEWGYESDHPFAARCEKIAKTGIPFYVCPGTSSWNSIAGRTENCLANLVNAAINGLKYGATGFLITDWGDNGHWQYLPISYTGFGFGAGVSWCLQTNFDMPIEKAVGLFAFNDRTFNAGYLAYELGSVATKTGVYTANCSPLFLAIREDFCNPVFTVVMRKKGFISAQQQLQKAEKYLAKIHIEGSEKNLVRGEFKNAIRLLEHACRKGLLMLEKYEKGKEISRDSIKRLIRDAEQLISAHKKLWLERNRAGGLEESVELLEKFTTVSYRKLIESRTSVQYKQIQC